MKKEQKKPRHHERPDLGGEYKYTDIGQFVLIVLFAVALLVDGVFLHILRKWKTALPFLARLPLALAFFGPAVFLGWKSHNQVFGQTRQKLTVISDGVYRVVRHPMYLASMMVFVGFLCLTLSAAGLIVFLLVVAFYIHVTRAEEKILIRKLGDEYLRYMKDVPMFIPRLKRRKG